MHKWKKNTIQSWHKTYEESGGVLQREGAGRSQSSSEEIESVLAAYTRNPGTFMHRFSTQLHILHSTIHTCLRHYVYKVQLPQALEQENNLRRIRFVVIMFIRVDLDPRFSKRVCFSNGSTFHVPGRLSRHISRICCSENSHEIR